MESDPFYEATKVMMELGGAYDDTCTNCCYSSLPCEVVGNKWLALSNLYSATGNFANTQGKRSVTLKKMEQKSIIVRIVIGRSFRACACLQAMYKDDLISAKFGLDNTKNTKEIKKRLLINYLYPVVMAISRSKFVVITNG
ncbi:hypothetical protein CASFOL_029315 [Castilleja foliolosa]|uniref:Pentatricopeptide repeat-containing protein n=1 Tax=Castilleja foliolosa TaxID=1961234 RepID=A0ABD3CBX3_9LAMI